MYNYAAIFKSKTQHLNDYEKNNDFIVSILRWPYAAAVPLKRSLQIISNRGQK